MSTYDYFDKIRFIFIFMSNFMFTFGSLGVPWGISRYSEMRQWSLKICGLTGTVPWQHVYQAGKFGIMLVSPPIYLRYFCVSMLLLPFDLKSWPLMKRTRDNVIGYVWQAWPWYMLQSLQNALFGYFIQECLSLFDIVYLPWVIHMSMPSAEPLDTKVLEYCSIND